MWFKKVLAIFGLGWMLSFGLIVVFYKRSVEICERVEVSIPHGSKVEDVFLALRLEIWKEFHRSAQLAVDVLGFALVGMLLLLLLGRAMKKVQGFFPGRGKI